MAKMIQVAILIPFRQQARERAFLQMNDERTRNA
jgi:hypothetical protein